MDGWMDGWMDVCPNGWTSSVCLYLMNMNIPARWAPKHKQAIFSEMTETAFVTFHQFMELSGNKILRWYLQESNGMHTKAPNAKC
jgi:hypothetical protein